MKFYEKYVTERLYSDIETKGFWGKVNSISDVHCICNVVVDKDTGEDVVLLFHDHPDFDNAEVFDKYDEKNYTIPVRAGTLQEGFDFWYKVGQSGGRLSIHNCRTFDKPITEKVRPDCVIPFEVWEDTLVQSKVQWYDRPVPKGAKSAHGLNGYGIKFGIKKPDVTDWEIFTPYICYRVIEDCLIQKQTALFLDREAEILKQKGIDFTQALFIENHYAELCWKQELHGALVDVPHMVKCLEFLDKELERLAEDIEPKLPMTLKKKASKKVGRKEISLLLTGRDIPDVMDDGEVVKMYYKPSVNFTNNNKKLVYNGFHLSYGDSPKFDKLTEMRDWVKNNHPDTKFKEWEYQKEEVNSFVLDNHTCKHFNLNPEDIDVVVGPHTRIDWVKSKMTQHEVVKGFLIKEGITWAKEWNFKKVDKQMVRAEYDMEIRYPQNALPEHQMVYEVKKGEPIVSSPKFGESEYEQLGEGSEMGRNIAKYNTYMHRRRFISNPKDPEEKGVMAYVRSDGRVPCGLGNFMTSTGRSNQRVIVNLPSTKALFGEEMRKIIIVPEGKKLVGADQKSSQLSIAAFIANNVEYYTAVASGQQTIENEDGTKTYLGESAHCVNARNFGLVSHEDWRRARETQDHDLIAHISMMRDKYAKGLAFACVPVHNSEVLTRAGWKFYHDLEVGMEILTYNRETGYNEYQPIKHLHLFNDKEVIRMGNSSWSMDSTGDHRWLGLRRTGRGRTRREVEEFITTDDIKSEFKIYNSARLVEQEHKLDISIDEARILGWIFSDGYLKWSPESNAPSTSKGSRRGVVASITQTDKKYGKEIEDLLIKVNALTSKSYKTYAVSPCADYGIKTNYIKDLWGRAGFCQQDKHNVNLEKFMLSISMAHINAFMDSFHKADGYYSTYRGYKYYTQNKGNIFDGLLMALTLQGVNYSLSSKGVCVPSGNECFDILCKEKTFTGSTNFTKECIGVMDTFCVTTDNSTFICRQGGVVSITGNCIFGASGKKMGMMLKKDAKAGNEAKQRYLKEMGLDLVLEFVERCSVQFKHGGGFYIPIAFGYWLWCRSPHVGVNYFCQGLEALVQKIAVLNFNKKIKQIGWDSHTATILQVHDEQLIETNESLASEVGKMACDSYTFAGVQLFNWYKKNLWAFPAGGEPKIIPDFAGGSDIGDSYFSCH